MTTTVKVSSDSDYITYRRVDMNKKIKKELENYTLFEKCLVWLVAAILIVGMVAVSYGAVYVITYAICWAFGLAFSPKIAFGVWLLALLINIYLK